VQQAIRMVLDTLAEFGSIRQVLMWLRDEHLSRPTLESERPRAITWRRPTYRMGHRAARGRRGRSADEPGAWAPGP